MKALFRSRLFLLGLAIRFLLLPFFGSHYLRDLFIPFLNTGIEHFGQNPWSLLPAQYFPYGSVLYLIMFIPRFLFWKLLGSSVLGTGAVGLAVTKLPLLVADLFLLRILLQISSRDRDRVLTYYWLNPIVIFITYIHGQLDLVSMTFCVLSLVQLIRKKYLSSSISFAAATLCKFHVVLLVPFICMYLWNRIFAAKAVREISKWVFTWLALTLIGFIPLIMAGHFAYVTASSPEALRVFVASLDFGDRNYLYFGTAVVLSVLGRLCISTRISDEGLFFGSGMLFGALILVTNVAPGWYFWLLPFLCLFYVNYTLPPRSLFWALSAFYLFHFALIQPFGGEIDSVVLKNSFTLLQTALAANLVALWVWVIRSGAPLQRRTRPLFIGISGDSGSGKNWLSSKLKEIFDPRTTVVVEGDDYHRWERGHEKWSQLTHLNPVANDLERLAKHTSELHSGRAIFHPHYDHQTGSFTAPRKIEASRTVILQGLHTWYLRRMRDKVDLKIFLAPDPRVRVAWKVDRDIRERGHAPQKVADSLQKREEDSRRHIAPQSIQADWIIHYYPRTEVGVDDIQSGKVPDLGVRHVFWNDAAIADVVAALAKSGECQVELINHQDDFERLQLDIQGEPSPETIVKIAEECFDNLRQFTRSWSPPVWVGGYDGINQLLLVSLLNKPG